MKVNGQQPRSPSFATTPHSKTKYSTRLHSELHSISKRAKSIHHLFPTLFVTFNSSRVQRVIQYRYKRDSLSTKSDDDRYYSSHRLPQIEAPAKGPFQVIFSILQFTADRRDPLSTLPQTMVDVLFHLLWERTAVTLFPHVKLVFLCDDEFIETDIRLCHALRTILN